MKRSGLERRSELRASLQSTRKRRPVSQCTPEQREAVTTGCIVCGDPADPAHLIPRGLCPTGADDVRAVIGLCRPHHRAYDQERTLSVLEYLEPYHRAELAFAVERFGLLSTLERLTNTHWRETAL